MNQIKHNVRNAIIKGVSLNIERGILTGWIELDYGDSGQSFGGYVLHMSDNDENQKNKNNYAGHFIMRCIQIGGVQRWEDLKGKTIRIISDNDKIYAIGHIVINDWFDIEADFKKLQNESETFDEIF